MKFEMPEGTKVGAVWEDLLGGRWVFDGKEWVGSTPHVRTVDIGTWWSPREDVRGGFSMRVVSRDNGKVQLEAPLWNGHCLSWETTEADLLGRWVEVE